MHFQAKNTLKSNRYHTLKYPLNHTYSNQESRQVIY